MRTSVFGLIPVAMLAFGWSAPVKAESMTHCRATPALLDLGTTLPIARKSIAERKVIKILALGSSSTSGYGASNPAYAYPTQLWHGLAKALPDVNVDVVNRGVGSQDIEEMAARLRVEMQSNQPSMVVWQTGTNAAMHHMPLEIFEQRLRDGMKLGKSLGADLVLMSLQYAPAVVALPEEEGYGRVMARVAKDFGAGLFRRYHIMRSWYEDGMPYAQFMQRDGLHLNDFGQRCIGRLLTQAILGALTTP